MGFNSGFKGLRHAWSADIPGSDSRVINA